MITFGVVFWVDELTVWVPGEKFESHCASSLAAECMETQSDIPTRENVLFTDCFKAILVLLSHTQSSVTGKMGKSEDDIKKKIQVEVNQQNNIADTNPWIQANKSSFLNNKVYLFTSVYVTYESSKSGIFWSTAPVVMLRQQKQFG